MPQASILRLVDQGRFGDALGVLSAAPSSDLASSVLRAFLEGLVGNFESAAKLATDLLPRHLTHLQKAYCLETSARAAPQLEAQRLLRNAHELFAKADDAVELARFTVRYGRAVLNLVGVEAAYTELPRVRRAVLKSGDIYAVVDLHLLTAETEAKRNKRARSEAHLRVASGLLQGTANVFQAARLEQIRSNLAAFSSDFAAALIAADRCAIFASEAGWTAGLGSTLNNIALFKLALGDTEGARESLRLGSQYPHNSKIVDLAAKDTYLQILLAEHSADTDTFAELLWAQDFSGDWRDSYYGLWHQLTRGRLFLESDRISEAAQLLDNALPNVRKSADGHLLASMSLLAALAKGLNGAGPDAARLIADVYDQCDELPLEILGELQRVIGSVAFTKDDHVLDFLRRADRVFASAKLEVARSRLPRSTSLQPVPSQYASDVLNGAGNAMLHKLSALIYLASSATQLAVEALEIIRHLGIAKSTRLLSASQSGDWIELDGFGPDQLEIDAANSKMFKLGLDGDRTIAIWVVPNESSESIIGVAALIHLLKAVIDLREARIRQREAAPLWPEETPEQQLGMVVVANNMLEVVNTSRRLAPSKIPVLISGETGTGKELLARALHDTSPRKDKPFIPFNCSACARDMLDAQLFGYRRGAFTGAQEAFPGVIRAAAGGTLFLDEIGETTLDVQPKLLRFLESGEIHPLGEPKPLIVDVRVVAATNANLEQLVSDGRFREDLFYRLNVVRLDVPALRERREEIPPLVQHYLEKCSRESHKTGLRFAEETIEYLMLYKWPGNVRQLANEVRRLVALAEPGAVLMPEHLSPEIAASRKTIPASERDLAPTEFVVRSDQPLAAAVEHVERTLIQNAFKKASGFEEAAQILGLSRKGLYLKRQRLGLADHPEAQEPAPALVR